MKSTVVAALLLVPTLGLAGCGGDDSSTETTESPTAATDSVSPTPTDTPNITPVTVPDIPTFKGDDPAGIIKDVTIASCTTEPGTVTANGTVKNTAPGPLPRDIAVVMSWTVDPGGDVLARGVAELSDVAPGQTVDWKLDAELESTVPVKCVATALRGQFTGKG